LKGFKDLSSDVVFKFLPDDMIMYPEVVMDEIPTKKKKGKAKSYDSNFQGRADFDMRAIKYENAVSDSHYLSITVSALVESCKSYSTKDRITFAVYERNPSVLCIQASSSISFGMASSTNIQGRILEEGVCEPPEIEEGMEFIKYSISECDFEKVLKSLCGTAKDINVCTVNIFDSYFLISGKNGTLSQNFRIGAQEDCEDENEINAFQIPNHVIKVLKSNIVKVGNAEFMYSDNIFAIRREINYAVLTNFFYI
jgi:hypothetical protein